MDIYNQCLWVWECQYNLIVPSLVAYAKNTWLTPWKESFVQAWVDKYAHFGNRATSRVEGAHNTLKLYLQAATGDLKGVFDKVTLLLTNQHLAYDATVSRNKTRTPHTACDPFYGQLLGRVSSFTLGRIWEQKHLLTRPEPLQPCMKTFTKSMGLPCAHIIQQRL